MSSGMGYLIDEDMYSLLMVSPALMTGNFGVDDGTEISKISLSSSFRGCHAHVGTLYPEVGTATSINTNDLDQ